MNYPCPGWDCAVSTLPTNQATDPSHRLLVTSLTEINLQGSTVLKGRLSSPDSTERDRSRPASMRQALALRRGPFLCILGGDLKKYHYIYTHTHMYIHIYIYTYTHIHTHIYTHIHCPGRFCLVGMPLVA